MHAPLSSSFALLAAAAAFAEEPSRCSTIVDAKLVTAIDISDSVSPSQIQLQLTGLAAAIRSPALLSAIKAGPRQCVGFEVFTWHFGESPEILHWTIISNRNDAESVARRIEACLVTDLYAASRAAAGRFYIGRLTDISGALDRAAMLLADAPFSADHSVINIVGGRGGGASRRRIMDRTCSTSRVPSRG